MDELMDLCDRCERPVEEGLGLFPYWNGSYTSYLCEACYKEVNGI